MSRHPCPSGASAEEENRGGGDALAPLPLGYFTLLLLLRRFQRLLAGKPAAIQNYNANDINNSNSDKDTDTYDS